MFSDLFTQLEDPDCKLSFKVINGACKLVLESYWTVFSRQVTDFYIGENAIVPTILREDPNFLDGVPNNALAIQHSVAMVRQAEKTAKTAKISTLGNLQVVAQST